MHGGAAEERPASIQIIGAGFHARWIQILPGIYRAFVHNSAPSQLEELQGPCALTLPSSVALSSAPIVEFVDLMRKQQ